MFTSRKVVCFLALLFLASKPWAMAQGIYTQIDVPGASYTYPIGIDDAGDIVGWYQQSSGGSAGFLLSAGAYTTLEYPGSSSTVPYGINDSGQIVGYTSTGSGSVGFSYNVQTHEFTEIDYPGAAQTFPTAINNEGVIVGGFSNGADTLGFELLGSSHKQVAPRGATTVYLWGITAGDEVIGTAGGSEFFGNFRCLRGSCEKLVIPNLLSATVAGINSAGTSIVGHYATAAGNTAGFLYNQNGAMVTLQFPEATSTYAFGVNNRREVTGRFYDSSGNPHGFTWFPPVDAGTK